MKPTQSSIKCESWCWKCAVNLVGEVKQQRFAEYFEDNIVSEKSSHSFCIGNEATFECSAWVGVASLSVSHNEINNVNAEEDLDALFDEQHNENSETESEIVETDTISHAMSQDVPSSNTSSILNQKCDKFSCNVKKAKNARKSKQRKCWDYH